jgi:hypothetical protein
MPLNDIGKELRKATETRKQRRINYWIISPLTWTVILHIHSVASYLSVSNARSRIGGLFFLGNNPPELDMIIGFILNFASVIKNVVTSAAESEVGACFHNAQSGAPLRVTLTELGNTQPPTPLRTDSSTAFRILNETVK